MLELKNIFAGFNLHTPSEKIVLNDFNLKVEDGEFIVLLGSNGAGKSTLFNILLNSIPYSGDVVLDGKNINSLPQHKRCKDISIVYQDPLKGTSPNLKVIENLLLANKKRFFFGASKDFKKKVYNDLSSYNLGLESQLYYKANQLSGGQRQALTLYMATMSSLKILLLDEHTAALDPKTQKQVMEITKSLVEDKKLTTLMITHNLDTALEYGNRLIILNGGKIVIDLKDDEKKKMNKDELLRLYSNHLSDKNIF